MSVNNVLSEEEQLLLYRYNQEDSTVSCPNCGAEVLHYDVYCYSCGADLSVFREDNISSLRDFTVDIALSLKYAAVCFVRELVADPFLFQKTPVLDSFFIHFKPLSAYDVREYLLSEGFIKIVGGMDKFNAYFNSCSDELLSYVLTQYKLNPGSSREDNISIILNSLPENVLERLCSPFYLISDKCREYVEKNMHCILYNDIFYDYDLGYYDSEFKNSADLKEFLISIIDDSLDDSITSLKWKSYSNLLFKYAQVYDYFNDYESMLNYLFQHFICEINPFGDNTIRSKVEISKALHSCIIYAISKYYKGYDEVLSIFSSAYDEVALPKKFIAKKDALLLMEELFTNPTENRAINKHLIGVYGYERIDTKSLKFDDEDQQEKVIGEYTKNHLK